jgi:hypothetical protein
MIKLGTRLSKKTLFTDMKVNIFWNTPNIGDPDFSKRIQSRYLLDLFDIEKFKLPEQIKSVLK